VTSTQNWTGLWETSLNPVPNAQVCVFDCTYYKITTTNYISETSLYTTFCMYPWGPWPLKILMFALVVTREIATPSWSCWVCCWYWYQNLGGAPLGLGMPFLDRRHMRRRGGYLFLPRFSSLYDAIHGWKFHKKRPQCPLLYVIFWNPSYGHPWIIPKAISEITTSFSNLTLRFFLNNSFHFITISLFFPIHQHGYEFSFLTCMKFILN
jgi:hypothetical protein